MQIRTTRRYHLILVGMAITEYFTHNKCWRGYREKGTLLHGWWEGKLVQPQWKTVWRFFKCCSHAFWETNSLRRTMQIVECSLLHWWVQGRVSS